MNVIGIDPGHTQSAVVHLVENRIVFKGKFGNEQVRFMLSSSPGFPFVGTANDLLSADVLLIEKIASYGMPVGEEVFETVYWSGRFAESWKGRLERLTRNQVKMALCYRTKGVNDSVIRQRLIDMHGGKAVAIGNKKQPGPLYGVKADEWAALALVKAWLCGRGL